MDTSLLHKLETGIARLQGLSPDGAAIKNDVGFNGTHVGIGASLASSIGDWSPRSAILAWRVCQVYRNTQLSDLEIPVAPRFDDDAAAVELTQVVETRRAESQKKLVAETSSKVDYGLGFSSWKCVQTSVGLREVRTAPTTEAFWAVWRADKNTVKAAGYSVSQYNGQWQVSQWRKVEQVESAVELGVEAPLSRTDGMLAYQVPSVTRLVNALRRHRAAVDASDTGTGKTYVALAAMRELGLTPTVVAPKSVLASWKRAAAHYGIEIRAVNYELVRRGSTPYGKIVGEKKGKQDGRRFVWSPDVEALIFDEAHRAKGSDTLNALLIRGAADQRIPTVAASATLGHNPLEFRAVGRLLGLHNWQNFWNWSKSYGCRPAYFGGFEFAGSESDLERLGKQIFPDKGVRIRIADLGDAFPETQIATELVDLNGDTAKLNAVYAEMEAEIKALEETAAKDKKNTTALQLTAALRARQKAELVKVPAFVEQVEDGIENGLSVFVAVNFRETLSAISERLAALDIKHGVVIGGQDAAERDAAIASFQADETRVILVMIQAGGVGISLHDLNGKHARLALISPTWSAVELRQALGRVHRAGGKTKSLQRILFAAGTVEEKVQQAVDAKLSRLDTLNDADLESVSVPAQEEKIAA